MDNDQDQHFFEGAEKLFEIWFDSDDDTADLRSIERSDWESLLKLVNCEIISVTSNQDMVAYVLSESSMFVSKQRFILKTCGRTTLLKAVDPLLRLVKNRCNMDKVEDIFYSRKKFMKPELQLHVHQNFSDEVEHLDELFHGGAAYALGKLNRECWYLYTFETGGVKSPDQTLEVLMEDLDPNVMKLFYRDVCKDGPEVTRRCGIDKLLPGSVIDDFLFDPCGYSMNGLLPDGQYYTIHVTPEKEFSYVSFETNVPKSSYHNLVLKILDIFKPRRFLMTLFANKSSVAKDEYRYLEDLEHFEGYQRSDHQFCQFKNYNLTYTHYSTPTKSGKTPGYI